MSLKQSFIKKMLHQLRMHEESVGTYPEAIFPDDRSPERFEIIERKLKAGKPPDSAIVPILLPTIRTMMKTFSSLEKNPTHPRDEISRVEFEKIEKYARKFGIASIGTTELPRQWVFRHKAVLHKGVIVLTMKMDGEAMAQAPSIPTVKTVWNTYRDLGKASHKIAKKMRKMGFSAQAGHPLMGVALYPPLAQAAGLGWLGHGGLIITPEHGPCVRLAAVFTSIKNLPTNQPRTDHSWVQSFCDRCRICIKKCPPEAIRELPKRYDSGHISCVDSEKCFAYFSDHYGCSVCIRVCPFTKVPYDKLKERFQPREVSEEVIAL